LVIILLPISTWPLWLIFDNFTSNNNNILDRVGPISFHHIILVLGLDRLFRRLISHHHLNHLLGNHRWPATVTVQPE
jgi:hypothetical protein